MAFARCLLPLPLETLKHPTSSIFASSSSTSNLLLLLPAMAFARCLLPLPLETLKHPTSSIFASSSSTQCSFTVAFNSASRRRGDFNLPISTLCCKTGHRVKAKPHDSEATVVAGSFTEFKHLLLPITDRNPFLSEGTRQAIATTAALAKNNGADITVILIDEKQKESFPEHENQLSSIRWHLSEGGFQEYKLLERLGDGSKPTAIIGEVADDLNLDLVVLSMEAVHSKHVDANLLAEFIPCPVMLLPL
ncbi:uncharacterized protein LOC111448467 isoform X1 [Cucurbita moschata]|uniref:Uncharacterized protein LOC111448467 isoform X1 n=2 Tax=Cucurbita moschata TaxID=3662 RepID=A0A6J1FSW2_CUCMO|nr:uncharacterized protein LOC111448467 isoform X1 [Cucurbita moschata]